MTMGTTLRHNLQLDLMLSCMLFAKVVGIP